jgi:hypothetical protein
MTLLKRLMPIAAVFLFFPLAMAGRDLLFKANLLQGVSIYAVLLACGLGCLISGAAAEALKQRSDQSWYPKVPRYQLIRLSISICTWILMLSSLKALHAASVGIISKAYIPLLIVLGPFLKAAYTRSQQGLAWMSLAAMIVFMLFNRSADEPLYGYLLTFLAVISVIFEYIMLKGSAQKEGTLVVAGVPAVACILVGSAGLLATHSAASLSLEGAWAIGLASGILNFFVYYLSFFRYRLLPLGVAEYPGLLSTWMILLGEYFWFGRVPSANYFLNVVVVFVLLSTVLWMQFKNAPKPVTPA